MIWDSVSLKALQNRIDSGKNYRQIATEFQTTASAVEAAVRRHGLKGMNAVQAEANPQLDRINLEGCEEENFEEIKEQNKLLSVQ